MPKNPNEIRKLLEQAYQEKNQLEAEKADREKVIYAKFEEPLNECNKKISEYEQKLQELNGQKSQTEKHTKHSTLGVIIFFAGIFFGIINFIWLDIPYMTLGMPAICFAICCVLCGIEESKKRKLQSPLNEQIDSVNKQLTEEIIKRGKIYESDSLLSEVELKLSNVYSKQVQLEKDLKEAEFAERVGSNNLFVYADTENAYHPSYGHGDVTVNMYIDGANRGMVAKPFSIVHLNEGVHSVSFELHFHKSGDILTMKEHQFSLKDSNRFFVLENLVCSASSSAPSGCSIEKYDNFDIFIKKAKLNKFEVEKYLNTL